MKKRRFDQFSGIMKTHIISILVYLHNMTRTRSRGPLSDAPVRFKFRKTVFPQKRVKVSKFQIEKFKIFRKSRDLTIPISESFLMQILMAKFKFQNSNFLDSIGIKFESDHYLCNMNYVTVNIDK